MKNPNSHGLIAGIVLAAGALLPIQALSQGNVAPALRAMIDEGVAAGAADHVEFLDMNADGTMEAFVLTTARNTGPGGVTMREWRILAGEPNEGAWLAGVGYGVDPKVVPGRSGGYALHVDGAWMNYDIRFGQMRPFGDILEPLSGHHGPGRVGDERHFTAFDVGKVHLDRMTRVTFPLPGSSGTATLLHLQGDAYWNEGDGSTPYVILDMFGEVLHDGWSFLPPSIFPWVPGNGIQIMEAVLDGYRTVFIVP